MNILQWCKLPKLSNGVVLSCVEIGHVGGARAEHKLKVVHYYVTNTVSLNSIRHRLEEYVYEREREREEGGRGEMERGNVRLCVCVCQVSWVVLSAHTMYRIEIILITNIHAHMDAGRDDCHRLPNTSNPLCTCTYMRIHVYVHRHILSPSPPPSLSLSLFLPLSLSPPPPSLPPSLPLLLTCCSYS